MATLNPRFCRLCGTLPSGGDEPCKSIEQAKACAWYSSKVIQEDPRPAPVSFKTFETPKPIGKCGTCDRPLYKHSSPNICDYRQDCVLFGDEWKEFVGQIGRLK